MPKFELFSKRQYVAKAFSAMFWNVLGTFLPLIIGSIILMAYSQNEKIIGFVDRGDFCLYSAGLLSGAMFLLSDNKDGIKKWYDSVLHPTTYFLIIIAAALYCAIYIGGDLLKDQIKVNISDVFVRRVSYFLIVASLVIIYRSLIIDFKSRPPKIDVIKHSEGQVNEIMGQLGK